MRKEAIAVFLLAATVTACGDAEPGEMTESAPTGYVALLTPLPVDAQSYQDLVGSGTVQVRIEGDELVVEGSFSGMETPASGASLWRGDLGLRGDSVGRLEASASTEGQIAGAVPLTEDLRQAFENGEVYVLVRSDEHPEGVLRGWAFPQEAGR